MGLIELVLWVPSAALAMAVATWLLVRRDHEPTPTESAPFPMVPALGAVLWIVLCPLPALAIGTLGWELLLPDDGPFATVDPVRDQAVAMWTLVGLVVSAWVPPGVAVLGWLVVSPRRSVPWALAFGGVTAAGIATGLLAGLALPLPTPPPPMPGGPEVTLLLSDAVQARASGMLGLAAAGATLGISVVAASSAAGLRGALWASLVVPCFALTIGAFTTPPDVVSQILVAIPITATWVIALAGGAAIRAVR